MTDVSENCREREEDFQYWLADMDDALERFLSHLPPRDGGDLDYSLTSLLKLEEVLLREFGSFNVNATQDERLFLDGASRYLGETVRRAVGGTWWLALDDPDHANFGMPVLGGFPNEVPPICPLFVVTASLDRRSGDYIQSVVSHTISRVEHGYSDLMKIKRELGV